MLRCKTHPVSSLRRIDFIHDHEFVMKLISYQSRGDDHALYGLGFIKQLQLLYYVHFPVNVHCSVQPAVIWRRTHKLGILVKGKTEFSTSFIDISVDKMRFGTDSRGVRQSRIQFKILQDVSTPVRVNK